MTLRTDIQGLRAVAVALVLVNHLWPHRLGGGYIGVDVFFVISGFLITSHLLSRPPRNARDLLGFWARRIRRLLPAASLVIVATLLVGVIVLPLAKVQTLASDAIAASLYFVNWHIAARETNYFDHGGAASALQHYWSLSVEEQFYILWPIALGLGFLLAKRRGAALVMGTLFVGSLAYSIHLTDINQAQAYFVTTTRIWELALGGLLATFGRDVAMNDRTRAGIAWAGLGLIAYAALTLTESSRFPGWIALLPTLGAAAVIFAAADHVKWSPHRLWQLPTVQTIGNSSYAIYLWHWPIIALTTEALGRPLAWPAKLVLIVVTCVLSVATTRWVEDPVRKNRRLVRVMPLSYATGALLICVSVGTAWAAGTHADREVQRDAVRAQEQLAANQRCAGAGAVRHDGCDISAELAMSPDVAAEDQPDVYGDGCWNWRPFESHVTCTFGAKKNPTARIALIGNSHAGHWQPGLQRAALGNDWQVTTYLVSECWTVDDLQVFDAPALSKTCRDWVRWATQEVTDGGYDLVVTSNRTMSDLVGVVSADRDRVAAKGYAATMKKWTDADLPVLVLRDTPMLPEAAPTCLERHDSDPDSCTFPANQVLVPDPMVAAAESDRTGLVRVADLSDRICIDGTCRAAVGSVITLFDASHMTRTFSRTLAPELERAVENALRL